MVGFEPSCKLRVVRLCLFLCLFSLLEQDDIMEGELGLSAHVFIRSALHN